MDEARRNLYIELNSVFREHNAILSQIGRDTAASTINRQTGTWSRNGLFSKTPRFIVQFRINSAGILIAGQFRDNATTGKLGYLNSTNTTTPVCGVFIRTFPVLELPNGTFEALSDWEWILALTFANPLTGGSSSSTIDHFAPPRITIKLNARSTTQDIIIANASLFYLNPSNSTHNIELAGGNRAITYSEATSALRNYLSFDY